MIRSTWCWATANVPSAAASSDSEWMMDRVRCEMTLLVWLFFWLLPSLLLDFIVLESFFLPCFDSESLTLKLFWPISLAISSSKSLLCGACCGVVTLLRHLLLCLRCFTDVFWLVNTWGQLYVQSQALRQIHVCNALWISFLFSTSAQSSQTQNEHGPSTQH